MSRQSRRPQTGIEGCAITGTFKEVPSSEWDRKRAVFGKMRDDMQWSDGDGQG